MIPIPVPPLRATAEVRQPTSFAEDPLLKAAQKLETTFLAELLKSVRFGESGDALAGNTGGQFTSFMTDEYAENIVQAGGIGLAESFFRALTGQADDIAG